MLTFPQTDVYKFNKIPIKNPTDFVCVKFNKLILKVICKGTSLVIQWLRLRAPNAGDPGSIPGQGTRSHMHAATKDPTLSNGDPECCN